MTVQFAHFTKSESRTVDAIVHRALAWFREAGIKRNRTDIEMDISAAYAKCPLRLHDLLEADDFNFTHDIGGIYRHLNRETGELENCFRPRFSA